MPSKTTILLIVVLVCVVLVVIVWRQIPTPITPALTGIKDALFSLKFNSLTTTVVALIGSLGGVSALAAGLGYAYKQLKKNFNSVSNQFSEYKTKASQTFDQLSGQNQQLSGAKEELDGKLKAFEQEKIQLTEQASTYKTQAEQLQQNLDRQKIALEERAKMNMANFTQKLPGDSIVMDPETGNLIKVVTKQIPT